MTETRTSQPPLALSDILTDRTGAPLPVEQFVAFLPEHWDIHLVIGHVTEEEFNRRLAAIDHTLSGLQTVRGDFTQRWAVFERHEEDCESLNPVVIAMGGDPDDMCRCRADSRAEWSVRWVDPGTPGAVEVTTAFADADWNAGRGLTATNPHEQPPTPTPPPPTVPLPPLPGDTDDEEN